MSRFQQMIDLNQQQPLRLEAFKMTEQWKLQQSGIPQDALRTALAYNRIPGVTPLDEAAVRMGATTLEAGLTVTGVPTLLDWAGILLLDDTALVTYATDMNRSIIDLQMRKKAIAFALEFYQDSGVVPANGGELLTTIQNFAADIRAGLLEL